MILRLNKHDSYCVLRRFMSSTNIRFISSINYNKTEFTGSSVAKHVRDKQNSMVPMKDLSKVREAQKQQNTILHKRRIYNKLKFNSYLNICVDVGQINRAFNLLLKSIYPRKKPVVDIDAYNIVLRGWAKLGAVGQIVETRMHMMRSDVELTAESYAYILLGYSNNSNHERVYCGRLVSEMKTKGIDPRTIFQSAYLNPNERKAVKVLLRSIDDKYDDLFCQEPIDYDCKLLANLKSVEPVVVDFAGATNLSNLESWADNQRAIEWRSSVKIKSVANTKDVSPQTERYVKAWNKFHDMWRKSLTNALDEGLEVLQSQCSTADKIHLYPYLCSVDKDMLIHLMLDEVENNASSASYSFSTNHLHMRFGNKVMIRYIRAKAISDGSHMEKQRIYNTYLKEYCRNPELMSSLNPREFVQKKAIETKNYAIYRDRYCLLEEWPHQVVGAIGKFFYSIILREIKFDPEVVKNPKRDIKTENLVHAFYTAYMQIKFTHKIKEEFRAHQDFEKLYHRSCGSRIKFDYSFLPLYSPPMPWLSPGFGGYLTNKSNLVRVDNPFAEQVAVTKRSTNIQKLYPSLDSLNALSLCPWIVNKEMLDLAISLFRAGGDTDLAVPLHESRMELAVPTLKEKSTKADKIHYNREKKKYDQKRREMYSLWCDCHYRLSIANHFRDRVFWFPHNMDFRGRTYPIPPHFHHLNADMARSLLLFARGQPLGKKGLDWLKIHLINLTGKMKSKTLRERLEYANSILHAEVLDSADKPWEGRKWWAKNENPWQVLACCKEIAKAVRSNDPRQFVSHFPVHQDGSCNGLQHYAALGRDQQGALAVNLIPSAKPQDVYSRVVDIVESLRKKDAERGEKVAEMLEGVVQRKIIKQTVMTTVYGVTMYGAKHQIAKQLAAKGYPEREIQKAAVYLASKTFSSIGQMFNKSRLIQDWFNDCAHIIAWKYKQPVSWETPLGFRVVQPYTVKHLSSNSLLATTEMGSIVYNDPLSRIDAAKQKTAFPPNYIHSLDSSHMMLTSLYCQRLGISFVSVHDCYWTHANTVDAMNEICREQFVALHSEPLLNDLAAQFIANYGNLSSSTANANSASTKSDKFSCNLSLENTSQPLIEVYKSAQKSSHSKILGSFSDVPKSGDLDLNVVLESTYFFS